jgi:uncharacterized repeat protein (TIGR03803 family)
LWAMAATALPAQTFTTLYNFCSQSNCTDGIGPRDALIQATNGSLYGTTEEGGFVNCEFSTSCGTVFKITTGGSLTTLYSFCSQSGCPDGNYPIAGLVQDTNANLYGTTLWNGGGVNHYGTVFQITPGGDLTTLYSFCSESGCADGTNPFAGLVQASNGSLYGTTMAYGASGYGTVFKITQSGMLTTLASFGGTDGEIPEGQLVQATNGSLYGTTFYGGTNGACGQFGCGTVFKITPGGTLTTLHSFEETDGDQPEAGLVQATDGDLYGTTSRGGITASCPSVGRCGTVFKITPSGALTSLYSFGGPNGSEPGAGLIQGTDGNFYGTTFDGGTNGNYGTVFKITASGVLTTLHRFDSTDGAYPEAGLVQDTNGTFYGTTSGGGTANAGTVFSLSVGLGPFVKTLPVTGKVGAAVFILGTDLTGSTSVTFNGTPATFTVSSPSKIMTTLPAGATSGTVQVVTPGGPLTSNVPFTVE